MQIISSLCQWMRMLVCFQVNQTKRVINLFKTTFCLKFENVICKNTRTDACKISFSYSYWFKHSDFPNYQWINRKYTKKGPNSKKKVWIQFFSRNIILDHIIRKISATFLLFSQLGWTLDRLLANLTKMVITLLK